MNDPENKKRQNVDDEIDLRAVFSAIGSFFSRIGNGIISIILAFRKITMANYIMIVVIAVLGVIISLSSTSIMKPYYRSSMLLNSIYLNGRLIGSSVEKLNKLCNPKGYPILAEVLNVDSTLAKNIKGFSYEPFISEDEKIRLEVLKTEMLNQIKQEKSVDEFIERIRIENQHTHNISIEVYDPVVIPKLQAPVLNFFKSNPYVSNRILIDSLNNVKKRSKIQAEIRELDSLKVLVSNNIEKMTTDREGSNNVILAEESLVNPLNIIDQGLSLYDQELKISKDLFLQTQFEIIDGFTSFKQPEGPGFMGKIIWGLIYSLIFAYAIILLREANKALNRIEEQRLKGSKEETALKKETEKVLESV